MGAASRLNGVWHTVTPSALGVHGLQCFECSKHIRKGRLADRFIVVDFSSLDVHSIGSILPNGVGSSRR